MSFSMRNVKKFSLFERGGHIGTWVRWLNGGWLPVILRDELWKRYL